MEEQKGDAEPDVNRNQLILAVPQEGPGSLAGYSTGRRKEQDASRHRHQDERKAHKNWYEGPFVKWLVGGVAHFGLSIVLRG